MFKCNINTYHNKSKNLKQINKDYILGIYSQ